MTTDLTKVVARILLIPTFLVAMGVMVKGYADIGDGFSAGVIASLGVALQVMVFGPVELNRLPLVHLAAKGTFLGVFIALLTAFVPALRGKPLMTHWPPTDEEPVHFGALELITAVAFDVGVFLVVFGFGVGVISAIARSQARMTEAHQRENVMVERGGQAGDWT
jgi:multisubunit Na+/H+ antiporter MnhB subunit